MIDQLKTSACLFLGVPLKLQDKWDAHVKEVRCNETNYTKLKMEERNILYSYTSSCLLLLAGVAILISLPAKADTTSKINSRYVINGGEVYDTKTNLTWQRCSVGLHWTERSGCKGAAKKEFTFDEAQYRATKIWRIPDKEELESLIVEKRKGAKIDLDAFPDMKEGMEYWTCQPLTLKLGWSVNFDDGENYDTYRSDELMLRLVRSGR
jgi:hypothetical protein